MGEHQPLGNTAHLNIIAIGTGRARLCAYVKLSTLNSAIDPELRDRKVEDRANATSSA